MIAELQAERDYWDAAARTDARAAVWAEDGGDYEARASECLRVILDPAIRAKLGLENARALDLGCGIGRLTLPMARAHPWAVVLGVDISASMLALAEDARLEAEIPNARFLLGDGHSLPDEVGDLDAAFSMLTLQHLPRGQQENYVMEVAARLRRGAAFRFQVVTGSDDVFLSHQLSLDDVWRWCGGAGLSIEAIDPAIYPEWLWVTAVKS